MVQRMLINYLVGGGEGVVAEGSSKVSKGKVRNINRWWEWENQRLIL